MDREEKRAGTTLREQNVFLIINRQMIPLDKPVTRLGRQLDNDVVLSEESVSRFHAEIHYQKDAYVDRAGKTFKALLLQRLDDGAITKAEVFFYLGEVSHRQGDDKKAIQMLERALDNDKNLQKAKDLIQRLKNP